VDEIQHAINQAWLRLRPTLESNPTELSKRLARRQSALLKSPPRAWCLALRSTDTRLERYCSTHPYAAPTNPHPHLRTEHGHPVTHQILLDTPALWHLCSPVEITPPGQPLRDVAAKLGTHPGNLLDARLAGLFRVRHFPILDGHAGKPHPFLSCPHPLDPAARGFRPADPLWSWTATYLPSRLPKDFQTTLTRIPLYQPTATAATDDPLHPEHPAMDPPPRRKSKALPHPEPDLLAWYKWKDDLYLGYDWRNPRAAAHHHQRQTRLAKQRAAKSARYANHGPAERPVTGASLQYRGLRWLCPTCQKIVNLLFLPLPPLHLLPLNREPSKRSSSFEHSSFVIDSDFRFRHSDFARTSFACERCVHPKRLSLTDPNSWNELISYLTAGLLYGSEVPKPPRLLPSATPRRSVPAEPTDSPSPSSILHLPSSPRDRKIPYTPRPNRSPSTRRPQIEKLLLEGNSFKQIAKQLNLVYGTVLWHAQQVYKQHHVRSLVELLEKHHINSTILSEHRESKGLLQSIREMILAGHRIPEIAAALNIPKTQIYNMRQRLHAEGHVLDNEVKYNRVPTKSPR
jgi:hypothetical protein